MVLDKERVLEILKRAFPDGVIYRDIYSPRRVTTPVYVYVRKAAKDEGMVFSQWLAANGLI